MPAINADDCAVHELAVREGLNRHGGRRLRLVSDIDVVVADPDRRVGVRTRALV
jgi:hypothetical protein